MSHKEDPDEWSPIYEPTPEEEAEAAFYFFIQDLNHYAQSGKWGPRIWNAVGEETRQVLRNQVMLEKVGINLEKEFGY